MGMIRYNSRPVIHMILNQFDTTERKPVLPSGVIQIFNRHTFNVKFRSSREPFPQENFTCVLTCSHIHDMESKIELLTFDVQKITTKIQRHIEFVTTSSIHVTVQLLITTYNSTLKFELLIPKLYQQYLSDNYVFDLYAMTSHPNNKMNCG